MHTNHRRSKPRTKKKGWPLAYSLRWCRQQKSSDRRALERHLLAHERWDDIPTREPKSIYWEYW